MLEHVYQINAIDSSCHMSESEKAFKGTSIRLNLVSALRHRSPNPSFPRCVPNGYVSSQSSVDISLQHSWVAMWDERR